MRTYFLFSWVNTQKCGSGIVDLYVKCMFNFIRICQLFSKVFALLNSIIHTWWFQFFHIFISSWYGLLVFFFNFSQSDRYVVIFHCDHLLTRTIILNPSRNIHLTKEKKFCFFWGFSIMSRCVSLLPQLLRITFRTS